MRGQARQNVAPPSGLLTAQSRPPCAATIERQIVSPSPRPCSLVVKNGSNSRSTASAGMPLPQSAIETCSMPSPSRAVDTVSVRSAGWLALMASQALTIRFSSTCCSCTRSPCTVGRPGASSRADRRRRATISSACARASDFRRDLVEIERLELRFALLQQRAQPADDFAGALVVVHDVVENLADLGQIERLLRQEALGRLGVAQDRRQRLVQLVGQRAGELAEHCDARQCVSSRRCSLRTLAFCRPSSISAARNISGTDITIRNNCSESTFSAGVLGRKRPAPVDGAGDRQERDDQEGRIDSGRAESHRRPEEERQGQINQRRDAAFARRRPSEDADADGEQPAADQAGFEAARASETCSRAVRAAADPGEDRRRQHQVREGLGEKPDAPVEPVILRPAGEGCHERGDEGGENRRNDDVDNQASEAVEGAQTVRRNDARRRRQSEFR